MLNWYKGFWKERTLAPKLRFDHLINIRSHLQNMVSMEYHASNVLLKQKQGAHTIYYIPGTGLSTSHI